MPKQERNVWILRAVCAGQLRRASVCNSHPAIRDCQGSKQYISLINDEQHFYGLPIKLSAHTSSISRGRVSLVRSSTNTLSPSAVVTLTCGAAGANWGRDIVYVSIQHSSTGREGYVYPRMQHSSLCSFFAGGTHLVHADTRDMGGWGGGLGGLRAGIGHWPGLLAGCSDQRVHRRWDSDL